VSKGPRKSLRGCERGTGRRGALQRLDEGVKLLCVRLVLLDDLVAVFEVEED